MREADGNIEVERKHNSLFPEGPVIKFVIPPDSKLRKKLRKNDLLDAIAYTGCASKIERMPKPTRTAPKETKIQAVLLKNHDNSLFLRS